MKGPVSVRKAIDHLNNEMLSSPNDRKLTKSAIQNAVARGSFGVSPLKNGRPQIVPPELTHELACHVVMMQSSGEGDASSLKMRALAGALTMGTARFPLPLLAGGLSNWTMRTSTHCP